MKAKGSSASGKQFPIAPIGSVPARMVWLVDTGEQFNQTFDKWSYKVMVGFELPTKLISEGDYEGKPFLLTKEMTNSMHPKAALRGFTEGWIGELSDEQADGFDLSKLLGQACLLSVIHKQVGDKTYANIGGVIPLPDGMECPPQVTESLKLDLDSFNAEVYDRLPDWIKKKVADSRDFAKSTRGDASTGEVPKGDDPPPF